MTNILRKDYTPRKFAPLAQDFLANHARCALFAAPGMGKTVIALTWTDLMYFMGIESRPTLVFGPKRVAKDTWPEETMKWKHLRDCDVVNIGGSVSQRKRAMQTDAAVYTINYEQIPWLVANYADDWKWGSVIADESTRLKGFRLQQGGKRAQALAKIAHTQVNRWVNLTGTPAPNGLIDLWGQTWFLDMGKRLGRSHTAFLERWFCRDVNDRSEYGGKPVPTKSAEAEIHAAIKDICLTLDPKDWFDVKEPIVTPVIVHLPPAARKIYKELESAMFAELADSVELEVFNAAALTNKCLQLANGAVYHGDTKGVYQAVHDAKLEALESIVEESGGMPVLIAYQFVSDKERILKAFPKMVDIATVKGMAAFRAGDAPGGVAHPKSMGHGIDGLQNVTNRLIRFSRGWNLEEDMQMLERIGPVRQLQAGLDRPVLVYDIVAEDTLDLDVADRHQSKRRVQDLLLEACKRGHAALKFT